MFIKPKVLKLYYDHLHHSSDDNIFVKGRIENKNAVKIYFVFRLTIIWDKCNVTSEKT